MDGPWHLARIRLLAAAVGLPLWAQSLDVHLDGDQLHVSAPQLGILTGKPLEQLRNGAPAAFAFQLTLSTDRHATSLFRDIKRFIFSYDLWEEKFSVVKLGHPRRSAARLSAAAAEAWCVDKLALTVGGLPPEKPFWTRLEVRLEDPKEQAAEEESGVSLGRLIEIFSRRAGRGQTSWTAEAGPLRLAELRKAPARAPGAR